MPVADASGHDEPAPRKASQDNLVKPEFTTELLLDNTMIEVTPSVQRRIHKPRKHMLSPVVGCDRWCEGNIIEPYTTMYDSEDKLFKMWARAGSDWKSRFLSGHAAYKLYFTTTDGVHWNKPDLGLMEIAGRRDHNNHAQCGSDQRRFWRAQMRRGAGHVQTRSFCIAGNERA
jgi:hypothetical protein